MAEGDLTTLGRLKAWLELDAATTDEDANLAALITAVSAWVGTEIGRSIFEDDTQDVRDGTGGDVLLLRRSPVSCVYRVLVDDAPIPRAASATAPGYVVDEQALYLRGGYRFTRGRQNVCVRYRAGYETVPGDLEQSVVDLCATLYRERPFIGVQSKTLGGETVTFLQRAMPERARRILTLYAGVAPV